MLIRSLPDYWANSLVLSQSRGELHIKALLLMLAIFVLLGGNFALMVVGLFYAYQKLQKTPSLWVLSYSPQQLSLVSDERAYQGDAINISKGPFWWQLAIREIDGKCSNPIIIWKWQLSDKAWRKFNVVMHYLQYKQA
ncbi:hypothetical protein V757_01500 [Pelistega indica]|uniref:Uncharacterized protein n=1 Tax=Pelistega indica TaxID=1414851 RepID=V8GB00_9BURK|nr:MULTISPECIES: hypothetical protein [Pelistega]ETD72912.1 hypothetical protein V757_01500 [Pelistega indica]